MKAEVRAVPLDKIDSNPYRHIERYPIDEEKIEALLQSYDNSGFWDGSIQARPCPEKVDHVQIAFGHHRVETARRKKLKTIGLVVAERSEADMLRMMADENRDEFRHDVLVNADTIAAVVEAYGQGKIELEPVNEKAGGVKHLTSFPPRKEVSYTCLTVARFLGWTKVNGAQATNACRVAFDAFREKAATEEALRSLPSSDRNETSVQAVVTAAKSARVQATRAGFKPSAVRRAETEAAQATAEDIRELGGTRARDLAVSQAKHAVKKILDKKPTLPRIEVYAGRIVEKCKKHAPNPYTILAECRNLIEFIDDLDPALSKKLAQALEEMNSRVTNQISSIVSSLRRGKKKEFVKLLKEGEEL